MPHFSRPYFQQKPRLYFDENFPADVIKALSDYSRWKKKYKFISSAKIGNSSKSDDFHFSYCRKKGYTLITLDADFINDKKFPLNRIPGIIIIRASKNENERIMGLLGSFLDFINIIPLAKIFLGDTKFVLSSKGCVMWGRDAKTRELKKFHIIGGETTFAEIRQYFNY